MPVPTPDKDEEEKGYLDRCMGDSKMNSEFPDNKQRAAVCISTWKESKKKKEKKPDNGNEEK